MTTTDIPTTADLVWRVETDAVAEHVASLIELWFAERPVWLQRELVSRAWAEHVDLMAWLDHPRVRAVGIRGRTLPKWDGAADQFFVLVEGSE